MTYYSPVGGSAGFGGLGYHSLGAGFPIREEAPGMEAVQRQLQRLGYLRPGTGVFGADGVFGPRTATALAAAAAYVDWTGDAYTPTDADRMRSGTVTVPDDLVRRLAAARPNPSAPHASEPTPETGAPVDPESTTVGPHLDPKSDSSAGKSGTSWVPYVVAGGGVLVLAGIIAVAASGKKKPTGKSGKRKRLGRSGSVGAEGAHDRG